MEEKMDCYVVLENNDNNIVTVNDKDVPKVQDEEEEELLGSLTTYNEGSEAKMQQLRTSARVYKKMKLDSVPSVIVESEKTEKKEEVVAKMEHKKAFRILWTSHDKDLFFEALNEYGKDFESIYSFIYNRSKKKGLPEHLMKTKDQVRHLYYRTWHKISKYLQFSEGIKKVAQELYGLINYGEMRRKVRFVTEKLCSKLQDLIYRGAIAIRDKGKTIRIKTPMCRALRRLNQLDERYDELKLPSRIIVELKPKNMFAYLKVQSMAQNPRLRTIVPLQKRLSSIIISVSKKWKSVEAETYDKAIISKSIITNDCVPSECERNQNKALLSPLLRFTPPSETEIEIPSINLSEYFTRQSICLRAYENRLGIKNSESQLLLQNASNLKLLNKGLLKKSTVSSEPDSSYSQENSEPLSVVKEVVSSIIHLQNTLEGTTENEKKVADDTPSIANNDDILEKKSPNRITEIRKGWSLSDCAGVSVGDLYLMFGKHAKLVLEYSWDKPSKCASENSNTCEQIEESDTNVELKVEESTVPSAEETDQLENEWDSSISSSLRKLISLAKLHYRKNNNGHVCGCKSTPHLRNKSSSKSNKLHSGEQTEFHLPGSEDAATSEENIVDNDASNVNSSDSNTINVPRLTVFRRPSVPSVPMVHLYSQLDSLPQLKNRYTNRRSRRERLKQVVVQRKLSLLPNNAEGHQIVQLNIIPQSNKMNEHPVHEEASQTVLFGDRDNHISAIKDEDRLHDGPVGLIKEEDVFKLEKMDVVQSSIREVSDCASFIPSEMDVIVSTPSTSPSRILKESDNQWLNSEVADFSLSSFLGHLDSPSKSLLSIPVSSDDCVMNEETMS